MQITFPDGAVRSYEPGTSALQIAASISEGLARNVLAAKINETVKDANLPLTEDCNLQLLTWNDAEGKSTMWHSSAHLMAEALEFHFPGIKLAIGPPVTNGFYYDIDFMQYSITEKDLEKVEAKMKELAKAKNQFIRQEISKAEAIAYFEEKQDPYKLELLSELEDGTITFYTQGDFTDLCRGPHIPDTGFIKAVKLTSIAGAYWRGDEKNKQLTRIYGITFPKNSELTEYLEKEIGRASCRERVS
jgi:threonyl-tRNA synthetase